ncbi:hypothetical protein VTJ83DRAFT_7519 [Remersonia thermophila]|uniref:Uncharacterized protein n=1 Tax=Remersonia thermophila TaxID=72144 RepID=A0ABR4D4T0_9PEZI
MRSVRWLAASLPVGLASAQAIALEHVNPAAPVRTPAPDIKDAKVAARLAPRILTAAPVARKLLKRDTNTCGYVNGDPASSLECAHSEAQCLYNTVASAVGCCLSTNCRLITACVPYTSSALTRTMDRDRTRYCSDPDYPHCAILSYGDTTGSLVGYTIQSCDSVSATYTIYFRPTTRQRSRTSTKDEDEDEDETTTFGITRPTAPFPTTPAGDATDTTTTPDPNPTSPSSVDEPRNGGDDSSPAPVGAIVGGVVGGIAAIALLALAIFFIVRKKKSDQNVMPAGPPGPPPPAMAAAIPPSQPPQPPHNPYPPQPAQVPYPPQNPQGGFGGGPDMGPYPGFYDPRQSILKPDGSTAYAPVSPTNSPPPGYPSPVPPPSSGPLGIGVVAPSPPPPSPPSAASTPRITRALPRLRSTSSRGSTITRPWRCRPPRATVSCMSCSKSMAVFVLGAVGGCVLSEAREGAGGL